MNYHTLYKTDMVNGEGVRVTLFVGGCSHACKGCYNQSTWNPQNGIPFTKDTRKEIIAALRPSYISGLSLTGGDPFYRSNLSEIMEIVRDVREVYGKDKSIWLWSGYTLEEILEAPSTRVWDLRRAILREVNVFIDGKFEQDKHEPGLIFKGSTNQIIHRMR